MWFGLRRLKASKFGQIKLLYWICTGFPGGSVERGDLG